MPTALSFDSFASPNDNYAATASGSGGSVEEVRMDFAFEDTRQTRDSLRALLLAEIKTYEARNASASQAEEAASKAAAAAAAVAAAPARVAPPNSP